MSHGITFKEALRFWWKLGWISFGGPAGQIAIMHRELVEVKRWISEKRFLHALNYCMVLPGPEAQQLATYLGWLMHGTWGGIAAGALFVLPSLLILVALSWIYMAYGSLPAVTAVLYGIKPAVTAVVLAAAWRIGKRTLRNALLWSVAAAAFLCIFVLSVPFPAIILGAAAIGLLAMRYKPALLAVSNAHAATSSDASPAIIDDHTPTPAHCRYSRAKLIIALAVALMLGLGVLGLLAAVFGLNSTPVRMAWFFTKAAFLTFGGAYAVLPYVFQGAVEQYQWLGAAQMIDGLALGETTPGPLIMVVAFVGFVGGWTDESRAVAHALAGPGMAIACASVATFFTFLPSFMFILVGGPLVEATHGEVRLTAPLACITAAVVGVIVNLAVFFAWKVFWPEGNYHAPFAGHVEWFAMLIAAAAFLALTRFQANVIAVIVACGIAGFAFRLLA